MRTPTAARWNTTLCWASCPTMRRMWTKPSPHPCWRWTGSLDDTIASINYVVYVIILCAGMLAFVVLYNLMNINITERTKEIATIKVLGFYDKEVYRYIFREIDLLSLIGSLVGLVVGIPLHQFIIRTVEMDQMMFIRSIAPRSFVFSVALTMLFNFAVCLLMRRHVRQISMVESMKAPE